MSSASSQPIRHIVVVSDAYERDDAMTQLQGWYSALKLAHGLATFDVKVRHLCRNPETHEPDRLIALSPDFCSALAQLGITESQLLQCRHAGFNLGHGYQGWPRQSEPHTQAYAEVGINFSGVDFSHYYMRLCQLSEDNADKHEFCFSALLAKHGRFVHPSDDPRSIHSTVRYGLTLPLGHLLRVLKDHALALGVTPEYGQVHSVERVQPDAVYSNDALLGFVASIKTTTQQHFHADLYIECSAGACLSGADAASTRQSWQGCIPVTQRLCFTRTECQASSLTAQVRWHELGIATSLCIDGMQSVMAFSGADINAQDLLSDIMQTQGVMLHDVAGRRQAFNPGTTSAPWQNNVLQIGLAAMTCPELGRSDLDSLDRDLGRLLAVFPNQDCAAPIRQYYNQQAYADYCSARDFVASQLALGAASTSVFWQACQRLALSTALQHRMRLHQQTGVAPDSENQAVSSAYWRWLWMGLGFEPEHYDPLADRIDTATLKQQMTGLAKQVQSAAAQVLPLDTYMAEYRAHLDATK